MYKHFALAAVAVPAMVCSAAVAEEPTAEQSVVSVKIQAIAGVIEILTTEDGDKAPEVLATGIDEITKQLKELNKVAKGLDQDALAAAEEEVSKDDDIAQLPEVFGKVVSVIAKKDFYGCDHLRQAISDFADAL